MSSVRSRAIACCCAALLAVCGAWLPARAQPELDPGQELELIESTERSEDPLGIDDSTSNELDRAAARIPKPKPRVILPTASQGAALSSIAGVRESAHDVQIELAQGLAFVKVRLTLSSTAKHAAEVAYRLPLPTGAVVTRVRSCVGEACIEARPRASEGESGAQPTAAREQESDAQPAAARERKSNAQPAAARESMRPLATSLHADPIVDARGPALALRVAPIVASALTLVEVEYVAEAAWLGGRARFRVEPRGYDPNLAATSLHVEASRLTQLSPAAELSADAWTPIELSASLPATASSVHDSTSATCGTGRCTRDFQASARGAPALRPTWLLIDASPSMEGPARSRLSVVLAALLSVLPEATEMRALGFAARAQELGRFRADTAPLVQLADASMLDLDAATQPSSALSLAQPELARVKPRIVVLSDGLFDPSKRERDALLAARAAGAETWLVLLGDGEPRLAELFSQRLRVASLAEAALHGTDLGALEDALSTIAAKTLANGQKAGEQRVREQRPKADWPVHAGGSWLPHWLLRERPAPSWHSDGAASAPSIAALPYLSLAAVPPVVDTGLPKESVLSMLRSQLVPAARACLRTDRKGRADYAVGLAFHALFAQREVYEARVEGSIPRALRTCLESILPRLRVPAFSGRIRIRYPIYTEREVEPPVIELEPDVSQQLERAFSGPRALP